MLLPSGPSPTPEGGDGQRIQAPSTSIERRLSPARLNLQRVFEQSRRGIPVRDGRQAEAPTAGGEQGGQGSGQGQGSNQGNEKGRPRLLLMGQRRFVTLREGDLSDG